MTIETDIFPSRLQWVLQGPLSATRSYEGALKRINRPHLAASDPLHIIHRVFPENLNLEIQEVVPRFREGGAFVKYARKAGLNDADIEAAIKANLKDHPIRPWFNPFQTVKVARVLGRPWIEDLYRIPSKRLKVEFLAGSADGWQPEGRLTSCKRPQHLAGFSPGIIADQQWSQTTLCAELRPDELS